ncbi:hypothetical protein [Rhodococcus qingshengii]|uniref:hypothetical protein n=1 Tax=Rhodococcus qingshengii TaxID=334542 RepID=UPI0021B10A79|nr:hypothetical protein [Rhodococcus qingshengii]MCT6735284.1 hypothetical protein [Rhodococcus qingshengii]
MFRRNSCSRGHGVLAAQIHRREGSTKTALIENLIDQAHSSGSIVYDVGVRGEEADLLDHGSGVAEASETAAEYGALAAKVAEDARSRKGANTDSEVAQLLLVVQAPAVKSELKSAPAGVELLASFERDLSFLMRESENSKCVFF